MRFVIMYGKDDLAGKNIIENLKKNHFLPQIPIIKLKKHPIYLENSDLRKYPEVNEAELIVFASTHKSQKGEASLSIHAPGNFRDAELGGKPGKLSMTSAFVLKFLFQKLNFFAEPIKQEYKVTLESTHHGPSIDVPCVFIEIGPDEKHWNDENAGLIISKVIKELAEFNPKDKEWTAVVGIGGPHYCPNFNKIQLNSKYALGHIIPKYSLPLTDSIILETEQKTKEQIEKVILDWKGIGTAENRQKILKILEKTGFKHFKTNEI